MSMCCRQCGAEPVRDGITLFRVNATGIPGLWECEICLAVPRDSGLMTFIHDLEDSLAEMPVQRQRTRSA